VSDASSPHPPSAISRARLEVLFDGIFAIAMTLLVLELKVPDLADRHSVQELATALRHDGPTFGSYLLSFWMLGMLWYRHNQMYRHIERISRRMLVLQLFQLALAAFFPFCAGLEGRYPMNPLALVVYSGCITLYGWTSLLYWTVAWRVGAIRPELGRAEYLALRQRNIRGVIVLTGICGYSLYMMASRA
jgi:uncharacterized membrane protein